MGRLRPIVRRLTAGAVSLALAGAGCGGGARRPHRLVDGTMPAALPAALAAAEPNGLASRTTVVRARDLNALGRACVTSFRPEFRIAESATVVRRTGTVGETLTFADVDRTVVLGCDRADRFTTGWCGRSVGRLFATVLRDLRLDIACRTSRGARVGFGWVEPGAGTRWIATRVGSVTELAETAAGLPVRVVTQDVDPDTSSATFAIVEYAATGEALRAYGATAGVAG